MSNTVISVEGLSKSYQLGQIGTGTLSHDLEVWWARLWGKPNPLLKVGEKEYGNRQNNTLRALNNVNFILEKGEVLGLIGRNGAGKSTLLKILSRVTAPTAGMVKVKGRIASLLEVGTGFHPELTGRENIYLNGAILGMKRQEINSKFDEIVSFAEVEKFIDTPVKRYSSGMYVRLAFAVAAHLEPEILIVDEVLSVGDADFQKKCLGKMGDVAHEGRTIIFVSHNMAAVQSLCNCGIVLNKGEIIFPKKSIKEAIDFYQSNSVHQLTALPLENRTDRRGSGRLVFTAIDFLDENGQQISTIKCGETIKIRLYYKTDYAPFKNISVGLSFGSHSGENKVLFLTQLLNQNYSIDKENGFFECVIQKFPLTPNNYFMTIIAQLADEVLDWIREVRTIEVKEGDYFGQGRPVGTGYQCVLTDHFWD